MPEIFMVLEVKISTLLETIIEGIQQIKGEDIIILDLTQIENIILSFAVETLQHKFPLSPFQCRYLKILEKSLFVLRDLPMRSGY